MMCRTVLSGFQLFDSTRFIIEMIIRIIVAMVPFAIILFSFGLVFTVTLYAANQIVGKYESDIPLTMVDQSWIMFNLCIGEFGDLK